MSIRRLTSCLALLLPLALAACSSGRARSTGDGGGGAGSVAEGEGEGEGAEGEGEGEGAEGEGEGDEGEGEGDPCVPERERCDGLDNDCDGEVDEAFPNLGDGCDTGFVGPCWQGRVRCVEGDAACVGVVEAADEVCDGVDNDCDGEVDEGGPGAGVECETEAPGACAFGITLCAGGVLSCEPIEPEPETCDGFDNDCNGAVDDDPAGAGEPCETGEDGVCAAGTQACVDGGLLCVRDVEPGAEECNRQDDDCDGETDEDDGQGECPVPVARFLLSEWSTDRIHEWDPFTNETALFHTQRSNDADCNAAEGSEHAWLVEHFEDDMGRFVPGSGQGLDRRIDVPYAYPKHVTVFGGEIVVMHRNNATLYVYDTDGLALRSVATGGGTGQGMATDGEVLYVSFWTGNASRLQRFDADLVAGDAIAPPQGMAPQNNLVDMAFDPATGHFFGVAATGEGGTGTKTRTIVEFEMGGAVLERWELPFDVDGIGQSACD